MKRLHVSISVADLEQSVGFYSTLFGAAPTVLKDDYAKWMLEDPRVNFVIERRGRPVGVDHLGIQAENGDELDELAARLSAAGAAVAPQKDAQCCYARSDKNWVADPQGLTWETFFTHGEIPVYGEDRAPILGESEETCCA
jgi:catechol 2,3-dioxygenase-like lactoylglutathione lyase family enzyme